MIRSCCVRFIRPRERDGKDMRMDSRAYIPCQNCLGSQSWKKIFPAKEIAADKVDWIFPCGFPI